jgi:hypothetical protein
MRFNPHITATAVVLALGSAPAPALATLNLPGDPRSVNTTPSSHASGPVSKPASPAVQPNPDEQVLTSHTNSSQPSATPTAAVQPNPDEQAPATSPQPVVVRVNTPNGGFDWGDAGIGAASGLGLSILGLAGALTLSKRRPHRTRRSRAATS